MIRKSLQFVFSIVTLGSVVLGMNSCANDNDAELQPHYGIYKAEGFVMNEDGELLDSIYIYADVWQNTDIDSSSFHYRSQLLSDEEGYFSLSPSLWHYIGEYEKVTWIAVDSSGVYENDTITVSVNKIENGDRMYYEGAYSSLVGFMLKKKKL